MKHLKNFKKIGWDFDDTLILHPMSHLMWEYITNNPYDQEHHLITFRSGGYETMIDKDFCRVGSHLRSGSFTSVRTIPNEIWEDFTYFYSLADPDGIDHPYLKWKGKTCSELGIEVLIDDRTCHVIQGCDEFGIVHYHPDNWGEIA